MDRKDFLDLVPNPSPPTRSGLGSYAISQTLGLVFFSVIFCTILILLLLLCVYAFMRRSAYFMEPRPGSWSIRRREASRARIRGLDATFVEALPTFVYSSQNLKGEEAQLECTICLCEFEEGDKLRVLPNCKHSFHIQCIDMWFSAHSNCPVCRTDVEVQAQGVLADNTDDASSSNGGDNADVVVNIGVIEQGQSNGAGVEDGSNNFLSPRESEETGSPSASNGRFSRLHSLKRMLSRGREEKASSPRLHQTPSGSEG